MDNEAVHQFIYGVDGPIKCIVCGHDKLYSRTILLSTAKKTFFGVDWVNPSANCLICGRCGFIMWFMPK